MTALDTPRASTAESHTTATARHGAGRGARAAVAAVVGAPLGVEVVVTRDWLATRAAPLPADPDASRPRTASA